MGKDGGGQVRRWEILKGNMKNPEMMKMFCVFDCVSVNILVVLFLCDCVSVVIRRNSKAYEGFLQVISYNCF